MIHGLIFYGNDFNPLEFSIALFYSKLILPISTLLSYKMRAWINTNAFFLKGEIILNFFTFGQKFPITGMKLLRNSRTFALV